MSTIVEVAGIVGGVILYILTQGQIRPDLRKHPVLLALVVVITLGSTAFLFKDAFEFFAGQKVHGLDVLEEPSDVLPSATAYIERGSRYLANGSYSRAESDFSAAIKLNSRSADAHNKRGLALEGLGRFDDASLDFKKAIDLDPGNQDARSNLSNVSDRQLDSVLSPLWQDMADR